MSHRSWPYSTWRAESLGGLPGFGNRTRQPWRNPLPGAVHGAARVVGGCIAAPAVTLIEEMRDESTRFTMAATCVFSAGRRGGRSCAQDLF